ncbi:135_t:CDS:1, partial [Acaulospora morrowiae]
ARLAWILNAQTCNLRIDFHDQKREDKKENKNLEWSNRDHFYDEYGLEKK